MPQDIFEGTELTFTCRVSGTPPASAKFEVFEGSNAFETKDVPLKGRAADLDVTSPDVKPTEASYLLKCKVTAGPTAIDIPATFTVWPSKVEITGTNRDGGAAVENAEWTAAQGDKAPLGRSDDKGKAVVNLEVPGPFDPPKVAIPWRLDTLTPDPANLRKFTATIYRGIEAEFVSPASTGAPQRHYVNLTSTNHGIDHNGHKVRITVGAKGDQTATVKQGQVGDKIYFKVTFGRESARDSPRPRVRTSAGHAANVVESGNKKVVTGHVELAAIGGTRWFEIDLGYAGGDTCKVEIGGTTNYGEGTLEFVNWRKLKYRFSYPSAMAPDLGDNTDETGAAAKDFPDALRTIATTRLNAVFVEWTLAKSIAWDLAAVGADVRAPAAYLGLGGRDRCILNSTTRNSELSGKQKNRPSDSTCVQINICDKILKPDGSDSKSKETTANTVDIKFKYVSHRNAFTSGTWKAVVATPNAYKERPYATIVRAPITESAKVTVEATDDGVSCDLDFYRRIGRNPITVSDAHKLQIRNLLNPIIADNPRMRGSREIKITLHSKAGGPGSRREARAAAVQTAITQILAAEAEIYYHPGLNAAGVPITGNLNLSTDCAVRTMKLVRVTLPAGPAALVGALDATHCPIKVRVEVRKFSGGNGSAKEGRALYQLRDPGDVRDFAKTILHELGHMVGLAPLGTRIPSPGMTSLHVDNGGFYYSNRTGSTPVGSGYRNRHNGHHCAAGVGNVAVATFNSQTGTCLMFGGPIDTTAADPDYCADCKTHFKARKLTDTHTEWNTPTRAADDF